MEKTATLIGRVLMAHIFLLSGITKITGYAGTQGYIWKPWGSRACCYRW